MSNMIVLGSEKEAAAPKHGPLAANSEASPGGISILVSQIKKNIKYKKSPKIANSVCG